MQGYPGLTTKTINNFIPVEEATRMGHMRAAPAGRRSTTRNINKFPAGIDFKTEEEEVVKGTITILTQEPGNQKPSLFS